MTEETETRTVYEIGFHLVPRLTENEVPSHVDEIKSILDTAGAEIISEEFPTLIDLAYAISSMVSGTKEEFDTAHFGWIKFTADPAVIDDIDSEVRGKSEILRFIIVKTIREDTVVPRPEPEVSAEEGEEETETEVSTAPEPAPTEEATTEAPAGDEATETAPAAESEADGSADDTDETTRNASA